MKDGYLELQRLLGLLEHEGCSKLKVIVDEAIDWRALQAVCLDIRGTTGGGHYFGAVRLPTVDLVGPKEEFRKLGLLLVMRGLADSADDLFIRLAGNHPVNALVLGRVGHKPDLHGLSPYAVSYEASDVSSRPRGDCSDDAWTLPAFGFIDDSIEVRTSYIAPEWMKHAVVFSNSANGCLRLGKLLLDFSHPLNSIDELHLEPANRIAAPVSYEASFWLPGSFGDEQ